MKKVNTSKNNSPKKKSVKAIEDGELKKPTKLKPLKEKEKKNWKNKLGEDEDDFVLEEDLKLDGNLDEEEEADRYYDDEF